MGPFSRVVVPPMMAPGPLHPNMVWKSVTELRVVRVLLTPFLMNRPQTEDRIRGQMPE